MTLSAGFDNLGIAPKLLGVLAERHFTVPTPIQRQSIPIAVQGKDIIGIAQTGTGKTLAFGIPLLQRLSELGGQGLILLPTRELALQVDEVLHTLGKSFGLRTAIIIGGASEQRQKEMIRRKPHIIIATPGRLIDHMDQKQISFEHIKILILDEADRMFDMGFAPQIKKILVSVPKERQTMLFSATMPAAIVGIATSHMKLPVRIEVAPAGTAASLVEQEIFIVRKEEKLQLLEKLLKEFSGSVLVFSRTKHGAKKMTRAIGSMGHTVAEIHSNRSLAQRSAALSGFKKGQYRVLVATDIAARGIDATGIELVVNFDLPDNAEDYVHRIGRTGRAGKNGRAISFATPEERSDIKTIERLIRKSLRITPLPKLPPPRAMPKPAFPPRHGTGMGQKKIQHARRRY